MNTRRESPRPQTRRGLFRERALRARGAAGRLAVMAFLSASPALAQQSMTLSGEPSALVIDAATPGDAPQSVADEVTTYSMTVDARTDVLVQLDAPLPAGVTLELWMEAPAGAVAVGPIAVSTVPQRVVRDVPAGTHLGLRVSYEMTASVRAGVVAFDARQLTFSMSAAP